MRSHRYPHFLDRVDYYYTQKPKDFTGYRYKENAMPSDYFHRNVFVGFQEDSIGIRLRDITGVDNIQWGSDYPHLESTWPRSREILVVCLPNGFTIRQRSTWPPGLPPLPMGED